MVIRQGDVHWLTFGGAGSEPLGRRPAMVVQHDRYNRSAINTTVVTAITSSLHLAHMPGNVRLRRGEAGLPKASVVNVSQVTTVDKNRLGEKIGALSPSRCREVLAGLGLLFGLNLGDDS